MTTHKKTSPCRNSFHLALVATACAALLCAAGCTSVVSGGVTDNGIASEVVFPSVADQATMPEGSFVDVDNLRKVGAGQTKAQLYQLLGQPHFQEGLFGVREWDYVFNFHSGGGATTCQYKVIFDIDYRARSFHWQPASCVDVLGVAPGRS